MGIDDNQSALLKVAAEPVEKQVEAVEQIVKGEGSREDEAEDEDGDDRAARAGGPAPCTLYVFESKAKAEKPKQASEPVTITLSTAEYKVAADVAALETIAFPRVELLPNCLGRSCKPRLLVGRRRARVLEDGHELPDRPARTPAPAA